MSDPQNDRVTLHVCITCRRGDEPLEPCENRSGSHMARRLASQIQDRALGDAIDLRLVECLSGCKRGCTVALAAPDKWTFVIGDLDPLQHSEEIMTFVAQYSQCSDGLPVWRERPEVIRKGVLARVPPTLRTSIKEQP